ncbi:transporter [Erythrobacter sp. JK5]|uniref:transporter n=1 Tax=Erythrobacter sp. JK5 TaxID=2829500 RepID=UPI001BACDAC6|nr:transporter [Erythrobacter sp. JK5]QUL36873.1 transporter [Erythrobacter sp. JK5]
MISNTKSILIVPAIALWAVSGGPAWAHHVSVSGPSNQAGPITTITAATPEQGTLSIGTDFYIEDYDAFRDAQLLDFAEMDLDGVHNTDAAYVTSLNVEYGLLDRLSVSLTVPFFIRTGIREAEHHEDDGAAASAHPEIEQLGSSTGIGDLQLGAKYAVLDRNADGVGLALLAGLSIPTGNADEDTNDGERFETEFQPGSGSWDPRIGLAIGKGFGPVSLDASVLYTLRTEGSQDTNLGDHLAFNAGLSWRIGKGPHIHADGTFERHQALDLIVEVNGEWEERERVGAVRDVHSGGTQIFLAPGLRYSSAHGWAIYSSLGIPVHEDLNGIQNDTDIRFKLGVALSL